MFASASSAAGVINSPATATMEIDHKRPNIRYAEALGQGGKGDQRVRATFNEPAVAYGSGYGSRGPYGGGGGGGVGSAYDRERDQERREREMRQSGASTFKVFVGHLDPAITDADLRQYFAQFGPIAEATVMKERGQFEQKPVLKSAKSLVVIGSSLASLGDLLSMRFPQARVAVEALVSAAAVRLGAVQLVCAKVQFADCSFVAAVSSLFSFLAFH